MNSHKRWMIVAALCQAVALPGEAQVPQTINYQGKLVDGTNLVNASTTMVFRLYNNDSGGAQQYVETQTVTLVDGLYSAQVGAAPDFGTLAAAATNEPLYLEVQVGDTILAPRERVVSVMYALRAAGVTNGAISSAMLGNSAVTAAKLANNAVTGPKIAAGAISNVHVSAASIASNNIDWTQMPAGLEHGGFLSYTENGDFEVAPVATGADSIAQGAAAVVESDYSVIGGGETNWIRSGAPHSVIAGGNRNTININAEHSVIAGGRQNQVYNGAMRSFIGGGYLNLIYNTAYYSTIPGGNQNSIGVNARQATIGGGYKNVIAANASNAVIAGGAENVITNAALYAAIPGGDRNTAGGEVSFAAGRRAKATNDGTFVWADHTEADFGSTTSNQFLVRASGGVGINTNVTPEALNVAGRVKADGFVGDGSGLTNLSGGALVAGTVSNVHLANKAVTGSKIATATITFSNMAQNGAANGQVMKWGGSAWVAADDVGSSSPLASYSENGAFSPSPHAYAVDSIAQGCANVIFNGSDFSVIGGGLANAIADNSPQSAISGGRMNAIFQNTTNATIGGGYYNEIYTFSYGATIGGGEINSISNGAPHSAIGGGWGNRIDEGSGAAAIGGGSGNTIGSSSFVSVIAGGSANAVSNDSPWAAMGGGDQNRIGRQAQYVCIGGGYLNKVSDLADSATIGGGRNNLIGYNADCSAIAGGRDNAIGSNATYAAIAGGSGNSVSGSYAVALGGYGNVAAGTASAAAGNRAKAMNDGAFVWADSTEADFNSTTSNQFLIRAVRGVGINTNVTPEALTVAGRVKADGFLGNGNGITNLSGGALVAGTVSNIHLAAGAVTGSKIAGSTITFANIAQGGASSGQVMKWNGSAWVAEADADSAHASYNEHGSFTPAPNASGNNAIAQGAAARAGGDYSVVCGGQYNTNLADYATIGGGASNQVESTAKFATVAGGQRNVVTSYYATISGGLRNKATAPYATVSGGVENHAGGKSASIGGGDCNTNLSSYAVIGGGWHNYNLSYAATIGGGQYNTVLGNAADAVIGGGGSNAIFSLADHATIAGGVKNTICAGADAAVIGGGQYNVVSNSSISATIGGGQFNLIGDSATNATIGGGYLNRIGSNSLNTTIIGGYNNRIGSNCNHAAVLGGRDNMAAGYASAAAGRRAKAMHDGSFVWADHTDDDFASSSNDQFLIRASGGVGIGTNNPGSAQLCVAGRTKTTILEITGGSDLSERFDVTVSAEERSSLPGTVVSIDADHPGALIVSSTAHDKRVAGIVSGAGGVQPGMLMGQKGSAADGAHPVALSGRVYCLADASHGAIMPGDLLTTSDTPGHAMKVTDHEAARGAIIGKAMTSLAADRGLVLVLVGLQ